MTTRLEEVLQGKEANYILPFLWQHGEEEATIREEMAMKEELKKPEYTNQLLLNHEVHEAHEAHEDFG